jgi:hypothetical protein
MPKVLGERFYPPSRGLAIAIYRADAIHLSLTNLNSSYT